MAKKAEAMRFDDNIYDTIRRNIKKYRKEKGMTHKYSCYLIIPML